LKVNGRSVILSRIQITLGKKGRKMFEYTNTNKIFEVLSGSHAYGLNTPESDRDIRGLFIAPMELTMSIFRNLEQEQDKTNDIQFYELQKYLNLLQAQNPNIIELLWMPPDCILYKHPIMDLLLKNREKLLSTKVRHSYAGYAMSQMKRLRGHQKWITNPQPKEPPALWDYIRFIPADGIEQSGEAEKQFVKQTIQQYTATKVNEHVYKLWHDDEGRFPKGMLTRADQTNPSYVDIELKKLNDWAVKFVGTAIIDLESYQDKLKKWGQYWEWKKNRNEKRAALEANTGYDCKHASHTIRLLFSVHTILKEGFVPIVLPEEQRKIAMDVKQGKWTYEDVMKLSEELDAGLEDLYKTTKIPREVEKAFVDRLYLQILEEYFQLRWK